MSEKRFECYDLIFDGFIKDTLTNENIVEPIKLIHLLNEQQATISKLEEEKGYWKGKAMTLLIQVRRLTPRMTDREVIEFSKELEDE